jgi:cubilin
MFSGCGGTYMTSPGVLMSPNYPNTYPHNKQCNYLMMAPDNQRVTLTFTNFTLEGGSCNYDYVQVGRCIK